MIKKKLLILFFILSLLLSCNGKPEEARKGLEHTIAGLSVSNDFDLVASISENFSQSAAGKTCYYGRMYLIYGTLLSEDVATELYLDQLQDSGWLLERELTYTWILTRGENERIGVTLNTAGWLIESNENYQQARKDYPTLLIVTVDFMLPKVDEC